MLKFVNLRLEKLKVDLSLFYEQTDTVDIDNFSQPGTDGIDRGAD